VCPTTHAARALQARWCCLPQQQHHGCHCLASVEVTRVEHAGPIQSSTIGPRTAACVACARPHTPLARVARFRRVGAVSPARDGQRYGLRGAARLSLFSSGTSSARLTCLSPQQRQLGGPFAANAAIGSGRERQWRSLGTCGSGYKGEVPAPRRDCCWKRTPSSTSSPLLSGPAHSPPFCLLRTHPQRHRPPRHPLPYSDPLGREHGGNR